MATYNLIKKSNASTGQKIIPTKEQIRIGNLENRINNLLIRDSASFNCLFKSSICFVNADLSDLYSDIISRS